MSEEYRSGVKNGQTIRTERILVELESEEIKDALGEALDEEVFDAFKDFGPDFELPSLYLAPVALSVIRRKLPTLVNFIAREDTSRADVERLRIATEDLIGAFDTPGKMVSSAMEVDRIGALARARDVLRRSLRAPAISGDAFPGMTGCVWAGIISGVCLVAAFGLLSLILRLVEMLS